MNKRILAVFVAAAALLAGCNKKKAEEVPDGGTETAVTTAEPLTEERSVTEVQETTERPFREYKNEDFDTITVAMTESSNEAPVELNCIDISGLDFGEKIPVCNKSENAGQFYDTNFTGSRVSKWEQFVDKPEKGCAIDCFEDNGCYYIEVIYPAGVGSGYGYGSGNFAYNWSLFRYDPESGGNKEIYSWEAADIYECCRTEMVLISGGLFFIYTRSDGDDTLNSIKKLDLTSLSVTDIYSTAEKDVTLYLDTLHFNNVGIYENHKYEEDKNAVFIYDREEGKITKLDNVNEYFVKIYGTVNYGTSFVTSLANGGEMKNEVVTDHYRVSVPFSEDLLIYADEDRFMLYSGTDLHTYDLNKMEHYISDLKLSLGQPLLGREMAVFDGELIVVGDALSNRTPVYCLMPKNGLLYKLAGSGLTYGNIREMKDGVTFCCMDTERKTAAPPSTIDVVKKFYIIRKK